MSRIPMSSEMFTSQIPAIWLLSNMGYEFISREDNFKERDGNASAVILERILERQLNRINSYEYKSQKRYFSDENIKRAIKALKDYPIAEGFIKGNEYVYDLLTLGKSFEEDINGVKRSFNIKYIDWDNIENNVFHITEEMTVKTIDGNERRPDIVLFINGIPFVVIECKSFSVDINDAIYDLLRKQRDNEIPRLFMYAQILIATNGDKVRYAASRVNAEFYGLWREEKLDEILLKNIVNMPIKDEVKNKLSKSIPCDYEFPRDRSVTEQDKVLYSLLKPERLLELIKNYIVYDKGVKKIARYQQYFAIKSTLSRVKHFDEKGNRKGGVIWHTQGSGKSLTMVMLAKNLAFDEEIKNPKILIVTDRVNLDKQIHKTFFQCNMEPVRASSGKHLGRLIEDNKYSIITTGIKKFESLYDGQLDGKRFKYLAKDIFVLIDESHRSNYGEMNSKMKRIIPNGCYMGFTGTPLKKDEKRDTEKKFNGFIHKYKINQAVEDGAVLPLIYEGRHIEQSVNVNDLDVCFEKSLKNCNENIKEELKQKYSRLDKIKGSEPRRVRIATDIYQHFMKNFKGTKFKAMFATTRKIDAVRYKKIFEMLGDIKVEVIISSPGKNAYGETVDEVTGEVYESQDININSKDDEDKKLADILKDNELKELYDFWDEMMKQYDNDEDKYNDTIKDKFIEADDGPEILIVVDKLLTGFDAPRAAVLYIDKSLREHNLLQAIARVNRLYEGKSYGYIIDYFGLFKDLNKALRGQEEFQDYYEDDIKETLNDSSKIFNDLYRAYRELEALFKDVAGKEIYDYVFYLEDKERRSKFFELVSDFSKALANCYSTERFNLEHSDDMIRTYEEKFKLYQNVKAAAKIKYSDKNNTSKYDIIVKKLLDSYIKANDVMVVVNLVSIFDVEAFNEELQQIKNIPANAKTVIRATADTIASRLIKSVEEKIKEDTYYEDFAERIKKKIEDWKKRREREGELFNEKDYYDDMEGELKKAQERYKENKDFPEFKIYTLVKKYITDEEIIIDISKKIHKIITEHIIVGWKQKKEPQNNIINDIEDYLFCLKDNNTIDITIDDIDIIIEKTMVMAKNQSIYDK